MRNEEVEGMWSDLKIIFVPKKISVLALERKFQCER